MSQESRRTRSQFAKSDTSTHSTGGLPDEGAGHRQARLEHILLDELQSLINDEATDPSLDGIKILAVHLSADGGHARVAYAVAALLSREQEVGRASKDGLVRATGFLRARLAQLHLKKLPKLTFTFVGIAQVGNDKATGGDKAGGEPCPE
jgi:ribosome-binding factor A